MADEKHLEILEKGVDTWNHWRDRHPYLEPNLSYADLSHTNLNYADLSRAKLSYSNFSYADLSRANLSYAQLEGANLSSANLNYTNLRYAQLESAILKRVNLRSADIKRADLENADLENADLENACLKKVQALGTNFEDVTLTGACIEDWNINSKTNLQNVKCDYIFLKGFFSITETKWVFSDRRPYDPNKIFAPGDLSKLFQKALETVDLIFSEGIEWAAFMESFQQLQAEVKSEELGIQAIEKKSGGVFVVRLEVSQEADKAEIEKYIKQEYDAKAKVIEANYQKQLEAKDETIQAYREKSMDMFELTKIIATNQPDITNNISVVSGDSYNAETAGILHNEKGDISGNAKVASEINEAGKQDD